MNFCVLQAVLCLDLVFLMPAFVVVQLYTEAFHVNDASGGRMNFHEMHFKPPDKARHGTFASLKHMRTDRNMSEKCGLCRQCSHKVPVLFAVLCGKMLDYSFRTRYLSRLKPREACSISLRSLWFW